MWTVLAKPVRIAVADALGAEPWFDSYVPSSVVLVPQLAATAGVIPVGVTTADCVLATADIGCSEVGEPLTGHTVWWPPLLHTDHQCVGEASAPYYDASDHDLSR